jgi:hypothetical protein
MVTRQTDGELREAVEDTGKDYLELTQRHSQLLEIAHRAPDGSAAMVQALNSANQLGPHVMMALRRYLDAIEILTAFHQHVFRRDRMQSERNRGTVPTAAPVN